MFGLFRRQEAWPIRTARLTLRPMRSVDILTVREWFRDRDMLRLAFGTQCDDTTLDRLGGEYCKEMDAGRNSALALEDGAGVMVGFVRFSMRSNHRGRIARVGILIGDRRYWNQGLGTEAMEGLLYYLFERRGIQIVELDTADFNGRARRCFEKVGFQPRVPLEGDEWYPTKAQGEPTRKIWMELLRAVWLRQRSAVAQ